MRVKCSECEAMILPATAKRNGGLCAQCVKISPAERQRQKEFDENLKNGTYWTPTEDEWDTERNLSEALAVDWKLEQEYYAERLSTSVKEILEEAQNKDLGNVFLVSDSGSSLNLSFTLSYGVVEYQCEEGNYCAYTVENLKQQVEEELHVTQSCACCGVGLFNYPSKVHMPRAFAFALFKNLMVGDVVEGVHWLDFGDISDVGQGHG